MTSGTQTEPRTTALTADEIVEYAERGFVKPGRVLTDDQLERLRAGLDRARTRQQEYDLLDPALWPTKDTKEPGKSVGFLFNLWREDDDFREVAFLPQLARWSSQLIGARQVRLLEDGAIAHAECTTLEELEIGDHVVVTGLVEAGRPPEPSEVPILYHRREFFTAPVPEADRA